MAKQLLDPADGISFLIQEMADLPEQIDVLRPIVAAPTTALERLDLRKFGLPEAEHVRRKVELFGNFSGGAIGSV